MILKALKSFLWSCYNSENGSRIHDLTSKSETNVRGFSILIPLLTAFIVFWYFKSKSFCWLACISKLAARHIWFRQRALSVFSLVSWWGKSHPYQIFRRCHYLPIFLFALSILCLGLRKAVWFRNRKSRDRQTGTVQGTEETQCVLWTTCPVLCPGLASG